MARTTTGASLEFEGLRRTYGTVLALDDLCFSVPAGQVVGFLGPNGAGKTTTMRAIFGLTDLDAGSVRWNGAPVGAAQRRRFGYMPEERGLYPNMLVAEEIEYLGRLHGMDTRSAAAATEQWLERLDVADRATSKVETLSHGNQQRVQLAAALVHDPEVLVLDEPLRRSRPDRHRRHRRGARRAGPRRAMRAVLEPPARPGRGPLRVGGHHRPRSAGGERDRRRAGNQRGAAPRASGWRETARAPGRRASPA